MWCLGWEIRSCRRGRRNVRRRRLRTGCTPSAWTAHASPSGQQFQSRHHVHGRHLCGWNPHMSRPVRPCRRGLQHTPSRTFSRTHIRRWCMLNAVSMSTPIFPLVLLRLCPLKVSSISVFHWSAFWWEYHVRRPLSYVNLLPHDAHLNICLPLPAKPLLTTFGWAVPAFGTDLHTICRR